MVKVVIVDDEIDEIKKIEEIINSVIKENKVVAYNKVNDELKEEIKNKEQRKIYILDIELGGKVSGIQLAKMIRDIDWESEIIFISNHDKMFESVHRSIYNVFDFIEKFHNFDKRLKLALKEIVKRNFDNKMFTYQANNVELSIYYRSILYIYRETEERNLIIVTDFNKFRVNMTLKEIMPYLDDRFEQCHRSCIVNSDRVQEKNYKDGYFVMDNGKKEYMLSKMFRKE